MKEIHCLNDIKPGQRAHVKELTACGSIRRRLLDIGLVDTGRCHRHTFRGLQGYPDS